MPTIYIKAICYGLSPITVVFFFTIFWVIIMKIRVKIDQKQATTLLQNVRVTSYIIIYVLLPTIANVCFSLFNCVKMDDGKSYLKKDMSIECWDKKHTILSFSLGLTFIIFWVLNFPAYIFFKIK